ncbi:MAG: LacI family DNA-binding transcriptional regulator [Maritimibacter sp.]|nr:LacI family DNA-binding transcriptional regulator [Maritimibacter sp.]
MARKTTLTDIAAAAGVSLATVDRVINGRGGVSAAREERILHAARTLGLDRRDLRPPSRLKRVAILIQPPGNPFHAELAAALTHLRPAFQARNMLLQIHHIDYAVPGRIAERIDTLAASYDGIVISGPDAPEVADALRAAARRLPVVTLATDIPGCGRAAFIGPDDLQAGRVAGDLIGRFLGPGGGAVAMIAGRLDIAGQRARATGIAEVLAQHYPTVRLVRIAEIGEATNTCARETAATLAAHPDLRAIYHTTTGATPLVETLETQGRRGQVVVITHELTPGRRRLLRERRLDAVIDQNPQREMRLAAETMARLFGRLDGAAQSISTEIKIYTPENA